MEKSRGLTFHQICVELHIFSIPTTTVLKNIQVYICMFYRLFLLNHSNFSEFLKDSIMYLFINFCFIYCENSLIDM